MAVAQLRYNADISEVYHIIDTIIYDHKKTYFLQCTANQAGADHKLHFQSKHPARAKLAAINNKNGCGTAEV